MKRWELIGAFETPVEQLVAARCWLALSEQSPHFGSRHTPRLWTFHRATVSRSIPRALSG